MYLTSVYDHDMEYDYVLSGSLDQQTLGCFEYLIYATC